MGSGAMINTPSFVKIGSGIQRMRGREGFADTQSMIISQAYFKFFKIEKVDQE
jgi:hypothetical protein